MVKRNRKRNGYHEEDCQYRLIIVIYDRKGNQVSEQNYKFGRDYVDEDGTHKEPLFALEDCPTGRAVIFDLEGCLND